MVLRGRTPFSVEPLSGVTRLVFSPTTFPDGLINSRNRTGRDPNRRRPYNPATRRIRTVGRRNRQYRSNRVGQVRRIECRRNRSLYVLQSVRLIVEL